MCCRLGFTVAVPFIKRPGFNLRVIVHLPNSAKSVVENSKTFYLHCGDF